MTMGITEKFMRMFLCDEKSQFNAEEIEFFEKALKHSSNCSFSNHNQRLAFVGDAILGVIIREYLCKKYPGLKPGELTPMADILKSRKYFAPVAIKLNIVEYMDIANPPTDYKNHIELNAEVFEAVIGASYRLWGIEKARELTDKYLLDKMIF
ncbi:hypothetical protein HNV12_11850 [Methanococcoides sp. SA1]|nr:hypothetical protein [Methanococcoides sp. SA1]